MVTTFLLVMGAIDVFLLLLLARQWSGLNKVGRISLAGLVFLFIPVAWGAAVTLDGINSMTSVEFCGSCHIMDPYLESLEIDDPDAVPATHYQNNWVPRETACYDCHTEYSMFGDVKAKINGLKHVWVNYLGEKPAQGQIKLYGVYANRDCLQCHGPAKSFRESDAHVDDLEDLLSGEYSCLECHDVIHEIKEAE
jgi:nitrate/TMAO reductase-like tetraheme cytochrome c subunit